MTSPKTLVFCTLLQYSWGIDLSFPPNFKFGAATAAYQIEGGWNADGKGESIWDRYTHEYPGDIKGNATGDIAADSYHLWREDIKAAAQMKLQFYRFSISWSRILPTGFTNEFNEAGAKYYSDLIDGLLAEGIEPMVTIQHWDLPVKIQDLGGWTNPLIVKWFGDYARVIFRLFSDRVKIWLTINEPLPVCDNYYSAGVFAPRIKETLYAPYLCNRHVMLAHATAYRIFDQEFRPWRKGRISIPQNMPWIEPATPNDKWLAELANEYQLGRYSHPIFSKEGGWPPSIEKLMLEVSLKEGFKESRLPSFSKEEKEFIKGTADFYAVNYYTTSLIRPSAPKKTSVELLNYFECIERDLNATVLIPTDRKVGALPILPIIPEGIRKVLSWLKQQYGNIDILITENGYSSGTYELKDYDRIQFIMEHLEQVQLAMKVDHVNVIGYSVWSLIDNFEWITGYDAKFGLYEVDFNDPNRTRTPRLSAQYYKCIIERHSLDVPDSCWNNNSQSISLENENKFNHFTQQMSEAMKRLYLTLRLSFE